MACLKRFELLAHGLEGRCSIQLSYRHIWLNWMVSHTGIEPVTPWLKVKCSTDWANGSYLWGDRRDLNPRQPVPQTGALPTELRSPYYTGAGNEVRTRDIQLGRLTLYQLSYSRKIYNGRCSRIWTYDPLLPRQVRYRAALYTVLKNIFNFSNTLRQEI